MNKKTTFLLLAFVFTPLSSFAANTLNDPTAGVVTLAKSCGTTPNCSDSVAELVDWISGTRMPSAASPLLVNIGPGVFTIGRPISGSDPATYNPLPLCSAGGYTTFRGAGRQNTVLNGVGGGVSADGFPAYMAVIKISGCKNLTFENLTVRVDNSVLDAPGLGIQHGVAWFGAGSSVWNNVAIESIYYGWLDQCPGGVPGNHQWYGSSVSSQGGYYNIPFRVSCGKTQFYGGQIVTTKNDNVGSVALVGVIADGMNAIVEIYGSSVHSINNVNVAYDNHNSTPAFGGHGGLFARNGAMIHMHGGIISVRSGGGTGGGGYGVRASSGGMIHTPDTAFGFSTGLMERIILEGGTVNSPFQWAPGATPPAILSSEGSDTFVETDCGPLGCQAGGSEPHMLIYSNNCTVAGPWFDTVTRACRVQ